MSRRLRVLTLIDRADFGGAERFAVALSAGLDRERFEPILCTSRPGGMAPEQLDVAGEPVRHVTLNRRSAGDLRAWAPLVELVRREGVEVIHAHMHGSNVWATVLGRALGVPVVVATEHTWNFAGQPMRRMLDRHLVGRFASAFASISEADQRRMVEIVGVPAGKVPLMPLGLVPRARPHGPTIREELKIAPEVPVVGTISVLRPQKALHVLVRAFASVLRTRPGARLVVAGDGPERGRLEDLAAELRIVHAVDVLGYRSDVARVLEGFDVYALSSDFEGTPIAILEAMHAARPVVSTAVGGVPALLDDGCGILVPAGDPDALAAAVEKVLADPALAQSLGNRAAERVAARYGFDQTVERWQDLYTELYERSRT
jgi:glycosyltransferase involved in cell wall biosynthesis